MDAEPRGRSEAARIALAWLESSRKYSALQAEERLWVRLHHARAMQRSHRRTFSELDAKWSAEIERCEAMLGLSGKEVA